MYKREGFPNVYFYNFHTDAQIWTPDFFSEITHNVKFLFGGGGCQKCMFDDKGGGGQKSWKSDDGLYEWPLIRIPNSSQERQKK